MKTKQNLFIRLKLCQGLLFVLLSVGWLVTAQTVQAAGPTCTVGASGANYTTIQAAVNDGGCTTINVAAGTYTENITIGRNVTINGSTSGATIVDGNNRGPVFQISGGTVTLTNLTIQHGSGFNYMGARYGGGIDNQGGTLTVSNSTFNGNGADFGGGIANWSTLIVSNSTFSGGSVSDGGGIYNRGTLTVSNSTFSGNSAISGGSLYNFGGTITLKNTILANALSGGDCVNGTQYSVVSGANNLIQDAAKACGVINGINGNIVGRDAKLGSLQNNGGTTATMLLLAGSPAIDAGSDAVCQATPVSGLDQRGAARPQGSRCDIGAVEVPPPPTIKLSFTPNGQNGWFTTIPAVGKVTVSGQVTITGIRCSNATVSNLTGNGTLNASGTVSVNGDGSTMVTCTATDSAGQDGAADGSQNTFYVRIDSAAPDTTITAQPSLLATSTDATFSFNGTGTMSGLAGYQCQLDGKGFTSCTSGQSYHGLSVGQHTFQVRAGNNAGTVDASPATYNWQVLTIKTAGRVVAWGDSTFGKTAVPAGLSNVVAVAGGTHHSLALKGDGTVVAWGWNQYGQTNIPAGLNNVVAIAAGDAHNVVLKGDGTVAAWGYPLYGMNAAPAGLNNVVAIAAGSYHNLALKADGTVFAWGQTTYGATNVPAGLNNVVAIAAANNYSLALKADGTVVAWGSASYSASTVPSGLNNVIAIAAKANHSLALKKDGTVVAWGQNDAGQSNVPAGLSGVVAIAAGYSHSLALKTDGTVVNWGNNAASMQVPVGLNQVVAIGAGDSHSLAITADVTAPKTTITGQPSNPSTTGSATFTFASSEAGSRFECSLDGAAFAACTSAQSYNGLSNGNHTFQVRATDLIGNVEATPASVTWTVSLPTATPTNTPIPPTATPTATKTPVPPTATPTATATNTPVPPTATPTATATNTPVPSTATPTATNTPVPPTATPTATATNTAVPPTATPTNIPAAPVANNDSYATNEDTGLTIAAPGVLSNDTDADSPALNAKLVSNPTNGTLTLNADGSFVYTPNANFNGTDSFTYQASDGQALSNVATVQITVVAGAAVQPPLGLTYSASVELVGAPCSVASNVLEDNNLIRLFPERLSYGLPSAVTVTASDGTTKTLAAGTLVDSYYLHADWVNQGQNTAKVFDGSVTFAQPVLGIIKSGTDLLNTHAILGAPGTTYATTPDQGIEAYDDSVGFSNGGKTVNLHLTVWNTSDALRVITPARPGLTLGGAVQEIGAPCSVVEGKLESDSAIRLFLERLNYVLPAPLTVAQLTPSGFTQGGVILPRGTMVNVYYVHADLVGDGQGKMLNGSVTFDTPILGLFVDGAELNATHNTLGATWHPTIKTAYSAQSNQGLESGDRISALQQNRVDFGLSINSDTDQIRIITAASGGTTTVTAAGEADESSVTTPSPDNNSAPDAAQLVNHVFLPLVSK